MKVKIKNSLSVKVFLWIAGSLILCSFLIYGSILFCLPKSYVAVSSQSINAEIEELTDTLSKTKFENSKDVLETFCSDNQAKELSNTMNELESANKQLKEDMKHIENLNKQQQYFFATASHELKTPMANRGMNPNTLQYLMGHANITMTLGYYAHGTFQSAKAELERLAC